MTAEPKVGSVDNADEKRYLPRWAVRNRILFQVDENEDYHETWTKDLSCAGLCAETCLEVKQDQEIKLTIFLSEEVFVTLSGKVAWTAEKSGKPTIGISFYNTDLHTQDLLLQYAFETKEQRNLQSWFKGWEKPQE